uniref:Ras-associating domain-containing protein n=1 Tax=Anopheles culicifacies TaxID=139723 RepID=A0A182LTZ0_9DIPT
MLKTTIKIYTACLRQDIEYKTLGISYDATSKSVVQQVLRRCKMRHRDPRLFYLTMEVTVRRPGVKSVLELDDEARPALLQACHPKGDSRFCLQQKPGGLIRVHTSALQPNSQYKSLLISEETTSDELLSLLLSCYNSIEPVEQFSLYEVCPGQEYQRKLHPDDLPLKTQLQRQQKGEIMHFLVRRNPNYPRRRQLLATIAESKHFILNSSLDSANVPATGVHHHHHQLHQQQQHHHHHHHRLSLHSGSFSLGPTGTPTNTFISDIVDGLSSLNDLPAEAKSLRLKEISTFCPASLDDSATSTDSNDSTESSSSSCSSFSSLSSDSSFEEPEQLTIESTSNVTTSSCHQAPPEVKSKNSAQHQQPPPRPAKSSTMLAALSRPALLPASTLAAPSYNPVYNIREIRTVSQSFSALGIDKKLADIRSSSGVKTNTSDPAGTARSGALLKEMVNTDPAKGVGNFVYI